MQLDSDKRLCVIAIRTAYIFFKLHATFPMKYPDRAPPTFSFSHDSQIGDDSKKNIVNVRVKNLCKQYFRHQDHKVHIFCFLKT